MIAGTIGIIGLGQMGMGMALNLLKAGHPVLGCNRSSAKLDRFVASGGRRAAHPAEVGAQCDTVLIVVADAAQVDAVLNGPQGLLQGMVGGTILLCSTVTLAELRAFAAQAAARGPVLIDSPISGGIKGAAEGTLTILCGGDKAVYEAQLPVLKATAVNVVHMGPLGAGLMSKLANNLIIGIGRIAIAEALALAKKADVPVGHLFETLKTCTGDSWMLRSLEGPVLRGEYPGVALHALKDLCAALDSGRTVRQALPLTALASELYQLADEKLGGLKSSNEVVRYFLESADPPVR